MAIEVFLIEDSEKLIAEPEHLEEWTKTVEELKLEGQQKLAKPEKSPIPFQPMNTIMQVVYGILCPEKEPVNRYEASTIPLRVLSLIALAEREKYFTDIDIWHANDKPDPIAVGYTNGRYSSNGMFILARWGDELQDFPTLEAKAKKIFKDRVQNKIKTLNADEIVEKKFANRSVYIDF
jgi:hypothetical protein